MKKIVTTIIILVAVVCLWRGIWGLLDLYLTPNNLTLSFALSILLGMFLILFIAGKNLIKWLI